MSAPSISNVTVTQTNDNPNQGPSVGSSSTNEGEGEPYIALSNGEHIPRLGFGLYLVKDEECHQVIHDAIKAGYRHFDSASYYGNEKAVGDALKECIYNNNIISREELFICSKVWNDVQKLGRDAVRRSFLKTLDDLQCTYLDMYLIHWPVPGYHVDTYKELELLQQEGLIKSIGLSNYNESDYEELIKSNITIQPVLNQMEVSPAMHRPKLIEYFKRKNIVVASFKSLNRGGIMDQNTITELSKKYHVSSAQLMLRWNYQHGSVVISKTSNYNRMKENRNIFHFNISNDDMKLIDSITTEEDIVKRQKLEEERKRNA